MLFGIADAELRVILFNLSRGAAAGDAGGALWLAVAAELVLGLASWFVVYRVAIYLARRIREKRAARELLPERLLATEPAPASAPARLPMPTPRPPARTVKPQELVREGEWAQPAGLTGRVLVIRQGFDWWYEIARMQQKLQPRQRPALDDDGFAYYVVLDPLRKEPTDRPWVIQSPTFLSEAAATAWAQTQVESPIYWNKTVEPKKRRRGFVFLSYMREDEVRVAPIVAELRGHNIPVWIDRASIAPGGGWADEIRMSISQGGLFLACFSARYAERDATYMNEELALASKELAAGRDRRWFIPVRLDACEIPHIAIGPSGQTIADLQWIDYTDPVRGNAALMRRVGGDGMVMGVGPFDRRLARAAALWVENDRSDDCALTGDAFFVANCWLMSTGRFRATHEAFDQTISDYLSTSQRLLGGASGWDEMLRRRVMCSGRCGMTWRLESAKGCTDCFEYFCPECAEMGYHTKCDGTLVG